MDVAPINGIVAMLHVASVERSVAFYRHLGFEIGAALPREGEPRGWAWLYSPASPDWKRGPNLMLSCAEEPVDPGAQAVLFYLYAAALEELRERLISQGLSPGPIRYPEYLPKGEFRLEDPDGYVLMIAQSADDTP